MNDRSKAADAENSALARAYALKKGEFSLRAEQLELLGRMCRRAERGGRPRLRRAVSAALWAASAAACAAAAFAAHSALLESRARSAAAEAEIARLRAELARTESLRREFAEIVEIYGRDLVASMAQSEVDARSALIIAEERYVKNSKGFNAEFRDAMRRAADGAEDPTARPGGGI